MEEKIIGLLGARSLVGKRLIPMLAEQGCTIHATTRREPPANNTGVQWHSLYNKLPPAPIWISMIPIWELPPYLPKLGGTGIRRLIAFSSTSRMAKSDSQDPNERKVAELLTEGEEKVAAWAQQNNIRWTILRPTLIYDEGQDKNISAIARFITTFGFFPVMGSGNGLRMPVYAGDLADAVVKILSLPDVPQNYYELSGKEALSYTAMVQRIFTAMGKKPRILHLPYPLLAVGIRAARILPRLRTLTPGMAQRMQKDQAFPHDEAKKDFAYNPRAFHPVFR